MTKLRKNWANYVAVVIFLFVLVSVYHPDEFGSLGRYRISEIVYRRTGDSYERGSVERTITLRDVPEQQLFNLMSRIFPQGKRWNKPYIERGNCFVYKTYIGANGEAVAAESVEAVGHRVNGIMNVTIIRKRHMSPLEDGIYSIREFFSPRSRY